MLDARTAARALGYLMLLNSFGKSRTSEQGRRWLLVARPILWLRFLRFAFGIGRSDGFDSRAAL